MATLLFVDDERSMTAALARVFRQEHACLMAHDGPEALATFEHEVGQIDLVVSDYNMPGMNGVELLRMVSRQWPTVKRILLTGWSEDGGGSQAFPDCPPGTVCLEKPFENKHLIEAVAALLAGKPSPYGQTIR